MTELDFNATAAERIDELVTDEEFLPEGDEEVLTDGTTSEEHEGDVTAQNNTDDSYYERLAKDDLDAIRREFFEAKEIKSLKELDNPIRFAELRELGLTPREAYLATKKPRAIDNRRHLSGTAPRPATSPRASMTASELSHARELFSGMTDGEIQSLYKRVLKQ